MTDADILQRVNETKRILDTIWRHNHSWLRHVLRHDHLLKNIFQDKMTDLIVDKEIYAALKRRAEVSQEGVAEIEHRWKLHTCFSADYLKD